MTFQAVPNVAQFQVRHTRVESLQEVMVDIYLRNTLLGWPTARLSASGTTIGNGWRDQVMPLLAVDLRFDSVFGRDLGSEFGAQATVPYANPGGDVGEALPGSVAAWVKFVGATGNPPRRGGFFIPGLTVGAISGGDDLDAAFRTALANALQAIDASIAGGGDAWVIVSRFSKTANPTPPHKRAVGLSNLIAQRLIRTTVGSQRDRRAGEGS